MTVLLTADDVAVHGAGGVVVQPLSLTLRAGHPLTILGETGSGKSLLAQAILGTLPKGLRATGTARIGGVTLNLAQPQGHRALWGRVISVLPQEPWLSLDPLMRAAAQVAEGYALVRGRDRATARAEALADLGELGLEHAHDRRPHELSGGMAQRVAFAAARAGGARIVVADEPTKGLDAARRDEVGDLLMREVEGGGGLLTITHDLALVRRIGGDVIILREGRVVEAGSADLLGTPTDPYTARLVAADPEHWPPHSVHSAECNVLKANGLTMRRGGAELFRDLSLTLGHGEVLGISGPSGCGKSTLGDILLGLVKPDGGTVGREGEPLRFQKLYQDPVAAFSRHVTVGQILDDLVNRHRLDAARIGPLMSRLRLSPVLLDRRATEVSGGELQRIALVRALLLDPVLLFADEPTSRLDPITQKEVIDLLCELARERNMGLILVSHDRALLFGVSDRILDLPDQK